MAEFNATLLREKFVIKDAMPDPDSHTGPVIALSNRLTLPLKHDMRAEAEEFIIRAQNMHTCVRLGAKIAQDFQDFGPILARNPGYDWQGAYDATTRGYESKFNPNLWAAVYHKGRVIFESGPAERHPFLDIIEQCDARGNNDYEKALRVAEDAFKSAGRFVHIEHDANVAMLVNATEDEAKSGIIVRGPNRPTTFSFTAKRYPGRKIRPSSCLSACASFLEGIQLAFQVGMINQKIRYELISASSIEAYRAEDAIQKLVKLNSAINQFDGLYDVRYRPDRPDFKALIEETEEFARKVLTAEIEHKIQSGEIDGKEWVL